MKHILLIMLLTLISCDYTIDHTCIPGEEICAGNHLYRCDYNDTFVLIGVCIDADRVNCGLPEAYLCDKDCNCYLPSKD